MNALNPRAVEGPDVDRRIGQAFDNISQEQSNASLRLQQNAAASGFGRGGGVQAGLQNVAEQFGGIKADTARGIRDFGEQETNRLQGREDDRLLQALGQASAFSGRQQADRLAQLELQQRRELADRDFQLRQEAQAAAQAQAERANQLAQSQIAASRRPARPSASRGPNVQAILRQFAGGGIDTNPKPGRGSNAPSSPFSVVGGGRRSAPPRQIAAPASGSGRNIAGFGGGGTAGAGTEQKQMQDIANLIKKGFSGF